MKRKITAFDIFLIVFFGIIAIISIVPYLHLIAKSLSDSRSVASGAVTFWPLHPHLNAYRYVVQETYMLSALKNTVIVTVVGTALALAITIMCAYPLSRPDLKGRKLFLLMVIFSMLFYGGIVPSYMLMRMLGLLDTMAGMIVPIVFTPFNMLVMKTFFEGIPDSIMESAKIDGANNFRILISIVLPVSLPVLATIGLYYACAYWNSYFHPSMFITSRNLKPLQIFLQELINSSGDPEMMATMQKMSNVTVGNAQSAAVISATVLITLVYPFLQKYFVKGLTLGSTKG